MPARPAAPPGSSRARTRRLVAGADQPQRRCFNRSERCSTRRPAAIVEKDLVLFRHDHAHRVAGTSPRPWCCVPGPAGGPATACRGSSVASWAFGHGWSACVVAGLIVGLQARVSPRQILRRTPGHGSYTHGARIPHPCGLLGPLSAAGQRDGGARYLPASWFKWPALTQRSISLIAPASSIIVHYIE